MDGLAPLDDVDTLQSTWALFSMDEESAGDKIKDVEDKVLQAPLARTVRNSPKCTSAGKCRLSGVPDHSGSGVGKQVQGRQQWKIALAMK